MAFGFEIFHHFGGDIEDGRFRCVWCEKCKEDQESVARLSFDI